MTPFLRMGTSERHCEVEMAVTPDLTVISLCEADDWDGAFGALDADSQVQGTYCLTATYTGAGLRDPALKTVTANLTGKSIFGWLTFARLAMLDTGANGGLRFRVEDGTKFAEWYVGGNDTSPTSGWFPYTCNCQVTPNRSGPLPDTHDGTLPNFAAITKIGWRVNLLIKGIVKWDAFRYGYGLSADGGTVGSPLTLAGIYSEDNAAANKYGVLVRTDGVYYLQGQLNIGSTTGGVATYFKDTSKIVVFPDRMVGTFYAIKVQGNSTAETKVFFGVKTTGGAGISGCTFLSAGTPKFTFTATDQYITELGLYGCAFFDAGTISLPPYSTLKAALNTTFEKCAEVLADTCTVTACNFVSADDRGVRITGTGHKITKCNFIDCGHGVHCNFSNNDPGVDFTDLVFAGSDGATKWDVEHSAAGAHKINNLGTSNTNPAYVQETGGGSTTVATSVPLKVTVLDQGGSPINLAQVALYRTSDNLELLNGDTNDQGVIEGTYTQSTPASVYFRVRKSSGGATKYIPVSGIGTIVAVSGFSATITLYADPNA